MVAEEAARGPESLPVLDFSELDSQVLQIPTQPRRTKKSTKHGRHASTTSIPSTSPSQPPDREGHGSHEVTQNSHAQRRRSPRRAPGQTARQAYQQRLEVDPSYVPTVGEFWGHDDRLLDKDLRSLSGWWRGRWQNGFRGRGGFRGSVRGRGGYMGQVIPGSEVEQEGPLPPVDRA
ncbi:hypothetical protein D9757_014281 [Collybiopsis confluens]|nr:hypothetical protein D9757_014281 [Collybiopsis confluens]